MSIYEITHFAIAFMCMVTYLTYGVVFNMGTTPFRIVLVTGISLMPVLNLVFTVWCGIYLIKNIFSNVIYKTFGIKEKVF